MTQRQEKTPTRYRLEEWIEIHRPLVSALALPVSLRLLDKPRTSGFYIREGDDVDAKLENAFEWADGAPIVVCKFGSFKPALSHVYIVRRVTEDSRLYAKALAQSGVRLILWAVVHTLKHARLFAPRR